MHPFGGTHYCPKYAKPVYAAEQVMGPGRKLYHKPCLACSSCNKRLDSYALVEHKQQPYCKNCHIKLFSNKDLRHANLPYAPPPLEDEPSSQEQPPVQPSFTGNSGNAPLPRLRPTRSLATSPLSPTFPKPTPPQRLDEVTETEDTLPDGSPSYPSNTGRPGIGTIPRTVPLFSRHKPSQSADSVSSQTQSVHDVIPPLSPQHSSSAYPDSNISPLKPTATGTRYGVALTGAVAVNSTGSPRKWGTSNPQCGRCTKSVYFAEQVKAVGKTFHKACLRCRECGTTLDSNRLRDHDGDPFCVRCYSKLHGPQGSGYALLGKAGA